MIRNAVSKDALQVGKILSECYNIESLALGKAVFLSESKRGFQYIVAQDKVLLGIASWVMHGLPKHGLCELDRIAVTQSARGKGVANELMQGVIQSAQKLYESKKSTLRKLYLLTHADNKRAQAFYAKMGFVHETTLKSHYYKDKDEWVMSMFF